LYFYYSYNSDDVSVHPFSNVLFITIVLFVQIRGTVKNFQLLTQLIINAVITINGHTKICSMLNFIDCIIYCY
jgi:hypothetical protein